MKNDHVQKESLIQSIRNALRSVFERPTMMILSTITLFVALEGNLGTVFEPFVDEFRNMEPILYAQRDANVFDAEDAARLDEILMDAGWTE